MTRAMRLRMGPVLKGSTGLDIPSPLQCYTPATTIFVSKAGDRYVYSALMSTSQFPFPSWNYFNPVSLLK